MEKKKKKNKIAFTPEQTGYQIRLSPSGFSTQTHERI